MLHLDTVTRSTLALLKTLQGMPELRRTRLVGGTALALQLGHRLSVDLDLFGTVDGGNEALRTAFERHALSFTSTHTTSNIHQFLIDSVQVDVVNYPYPWLKPPVSGDGVRLADLPDLCAMKLSAVANRGFRKDFVDVYFLLSIFTLDEMIRLFKNKFPDGSAFNVLQSLAYFDDAESEPMPKLLKPCNWEEVKKHIICAVRCFQGKS